MNKNNYKKSSLFKVIFLILIIFILIIYSNVIYSAVNKKNKKLLEGSWTLKGSVTYCLSKLEIFNQTKKYFYFRIFTTCGAHVGELEGKAKIISNNRAYSVVNDFGQCEVYFRKIKDNKIEVKTTNNDCQDFRGVAAGPFQGIYIKNLDIEVITLRDYLKNVNDNKSYIFENEKELIAFQKLVGPNYEKLFNDLFYSNPKEDEELNARVYIGSLTGFLQLGKQ